MSLASQLSLHHAKRACLVWSIAYCCPLILRFGWSQEGRVYSERFRATDIDWFKKVMRSFRDELGYTKTDTDEMMAVLTGILHLGQLKFTNEDEAKWKRNLNQMFRWWPTVLVWLIQRLLRTRSW